MKVLPVSALLVLIRASLLGHLSRNLAAVAAIAATAAVLLMTLAGRNAVSGSTSGGIPILEANEVHLAATDTVFPFLDEGLVERLRQDSRVVELHTAVSARVVDMPGTERGQLDEDTFYSRSDGGMGGWIVGRRDNFLAWDDDRPRGILAEGRWPSNDADGPVELVLPLKLSYGQSLGSWRRLESDSGVHAATVVGQVRFPESILMSPQGARLMARQISRADAELLNGGSRPPSDARIRLRNQDDVASFLTTWRSQISSLPGQLELWDNTSIRRSITYSAAAQSIRMAAVAAVLISAVCAACIGLAVQGNAAREREAQALLLRTLGAGRSFVVVLTLVESAFVALAGVAVAVVFCAGILTGLSVLFPFLGGTASPGFLQILLVMGVVLIGVLAGSIGPALAAWPVHASDAVAGVNDPERARRWTRRSALGAFVVLLTVVFALAVVPAGSQVRSQVLLWVGVPGLSIASVLFAPAAVRLTEALLIRPVAWLMRVEPHILSDQVAADGPRSTGAVIAIAVGLGTYLWVMCWGASMLDSFVIDERMPRWLVSIHPYGMSESETDTVLAAPGMEEFQPLILVDTRLGTESADGESVPTLVMGIEGPPRTGSLADEIPFRFIAGDHDSALADLSSGTSCLVSEWYANTARVTVGDELAVAVPGRIENGDVLEKSYRVVGIVELRGWRMATKQNKVRHRGDKHRAMVVLDAETVRRDFATSDTNYLLGWTNGSPSGLPSRYGVGVPEQEAFPASRKERVALEQKVSDRLDLSRPIEYRPDGGAPVLLSSRTVQVDDLDRARHELLGDWGAGAVRRMAWLPLTALAISLFSIMASLVVSLKSRFRELGILRSCGLTRFGLLRLVLAESLLITMAAVLVASLFGGGEAWLMLQLASIIGYHLDFAGIRPEFIVPWAWLLPGGLLTATVCGLAALWAGWRVGRLAPAGLLSGSTTRT